MYFYLDQVLKKCFWVLCQKSIIKYMQDFVIFFLQLKSVKIHKEILHLFFIYSFYLFAVVVVVVLVTLKLRYNLTFQLFGVAANNAGNPI